MKKVTLKDRVFDYITKHGKITSLEAVNNIGTVRLSHYIYLLKKDGYVIKDKWVTSKNRYGDKVSFKEYSIEEKKENS